MVPANGIRFRTMVDGPPQADLFILLHGFPDGAELWSRQVDALAKAGCLAVAPDLRGYGLSDAPDAKESYSIDHLVDDVAALIKAFGRESAHVAGHDWGAVVAWFFAARHPEMTKTLTALSVGHPAALAAASKDDEDQQARSRYVGLFLLEGKAERVLSEDDYRRLRLTWSIGPNPEAVPRSVVDHFARSLARPGRLTAALNYYRDPHIYGRRVHAGGPGGRRPLAQLRSAGRGEPRPHRCRKSISCEPCSKAGTTRSGDPACAGSTTSLTRSSSSTFTTARS